MCIFLTKKGNLYYAIRRYKDEDGKRKEEAIPLKIRVTDKGAAKKAAKKVEELKRQYQTAEGGTAGSVDMSTQLLSDCVGAWIEVCKKRKVDATTTDEYERILRKDIRPYFDKKGMTLSRVMAGDLEDFYDIFLADNKTAKTVLNKHQLISSTLKWACKHGWIEKNVAKLVDSIKRKKPELEEPYSVDEIARLLQVVRDDQVYHPMYLPVLLAAVFGLRRSEVLGLCWSAIDFEKKEFTIKTTVVRQHEGKRLRTVVRKDTTKSASSKRTLPLPDCVIQLLREIKKEQEYHREICGDCYNLEYLDFVCVNQMGNLLQPDYISQAFQKILKKHDLRHIRFHDLRHSCASILAGMGFSIKDIQTWLGHSDYNFTANTYVHTERGKHEKMAEAYSENLVKLLGK